MNKIQLAALAFIVSFSMVPFEAFAETSCIQSPLPIMPKRFICNTTFIQGASYHWREVETSNLYTWSGPNGQTQRNAVCKWSSTGTDMVTVRISNNGNTFEHVVIDCTPDEQ